MTHTPDPTSPRDAARASHRFSAVQTETPGVMEALWSISIHAAACQRWVDRSPPRLEEAERSLNAIRACSREAARLIVAGLRARALDPGLDG